MECCLIHGWGYSLLHYSVIYLYILAHIIQHYNVALAVVSTSDGDTADNNGPVYDDIVSDPVMVHCPAYESLPVHK